MKGKAAAYIAGITRQTASDSLHGTIMVGARYQTNANGGADSRQIDLYGLPFTLSDASLASPDSNGFVSANAHYSHDLAAQGDRLDADIGAYGALYRDHSEIDTGVIEARFGPVFNLERYSIAHTTLGIYALGGATSLEGNPYTYTLGAGAVVSANFDTQTQAHLRLEYRYEDFQNSTDRPSVSDMTGNRIRLSVDLSHAVTDWLTLSAMIYGERKEAAAAFDADWEAGATADARFTVPGTGGAQHRPWTVDLLAGYLGRNFDQPDPSMSTDTRHDTEATAQLSLTAPFADSWAIVSTIGYRKVWSNYAIYALDDLSTTFAVAKSF
jgi:hypothetical protein